MDFAADVYNRETYTHAINRCSCRRTDFSAQVFLLMM